MYMCVYVRVYIYIYIYTYIHISCILRSEHLVVGLDDHVLLDAVVRVDAPCGLYCYCISLSFEVVISILFVIYV